MTKEQLISLGMSTLAQAAISTKFPKGHEFCEATDELRHAAGFASLRHEGQFRKGEGRTPYIHHPVEVAAILAEVGKIGDLDVLQAALLHDTVEDTKTTPDEIEALFGIRVRSIVAEVTDDTTLERPARKAAQIAHGPHLSAEAQSLKLADKISNMFDVAFSKPIDWTRERQLEYFDWAEQVVAGFRDCNAALELLFNQQLARSRHAVHENV